MMKFILIFYACSTFAFSHPHFFIDSKISIEKDKIKNEWIFDRLNSKVLLFDFDRNRDKLFDEEEKEEFLKAHFSSLRNNNFNIFLTLDDEVEVEPKSIDVKFENKRISLSFDIEAKITDVFTMCTIDEKIYMAYKLIDIKSFKELEVQKSEYDYCIGVVE